MQFFRTILAWNFFVQCWPGIFLVQCQGNLANVGGAFAATGYYQKTNQSNIKTTEK